MDVVNLIPLLIRDGERLEFRLVEEGNDAEHLFVVLVIAQCLCVGFKEGYILIACKFLAELIDVYRLVVRINVGIFESLFGHKVHNVVIFVNAHHRAVHPRLIFGYERQVWVGVVEQEGEHGVVKDKVTLNQECVVLLQLFLCQRKGIDVVGLVENGVANILNLQRLVITCADMCLQFFAFITDHDNHAVEVEL